MFHDSKKENESFSTVLHNINGGKCFCNFCLRFKHLDVVLSRRFLLSEDVLCGLGVKRLTLNQNRGPLIHFIPPISSSTVKYEIKVKITVPKNILQ